MAICSLASFLFPDLKIKDDLIPSIFSISLFLNPDPYAKMTHMFMPEPMPTAVFLDWTG